MPKIAQGAEAVILKEENTIIKDRIKKEYRLREIDESLRGFRTRREAKILKKLEEMDFPCPALIKTDSKEKIAMEFIEGPKVRDVLEKEDYKKLCREIGERVAELHEKDIMHADLTTSNMILANKDNKIHFIDFGLSFFSTKIEDRAVDLHLLRQALESKHYKVWEECFKAVLQGYKKYDKSAEVIKRLETVEGRGRYKGKNRKKGDYNGIQKD